MVCICYCLISTTVWLERPGIFATNRTTEMYGIARCWISSKFFFYDFIFLFFLLLFDEKSINDIFFFQVFATCCTFYVPLLVILVLYWKIYQTARKRIHRRRPKLPISANNNQVRKISLN